MKYKKEFIFTVKVIISILLIYYLVTNNKIDIEFTLASLSNYKLVIIFLILTLLQLFIGSLRSTLLMHFQSNNFDRVFKMTKINWASSFVGSVLPIGILSEIYRINAMMKVESGHTKDNSVYTSLFSKIFSTISLITIVCLAIPFVDNIPTALTSILYSLYIVLAISIIAVFNKNRVFKLILLVSNYLLSKVNRETLKNRIQHFSTYNDHLLNNNKKLFQIFGTSLLIQGMNCLSILVILHYTNGLESLSIFEVLSVIPIGIFMMFLPISFSGLGIGHIAFSNLLAHYGYTRGADMFSIYFLLSYLFNIFGFFSFISTMQFRNKNTEAC